MVSSASIANWRNYPAMVGHQSPASAKVYAERLRKDRDRLFTERDISIDVLDIGAQEQVVEDKTYETINSPERFDERLTTVTPNLESRVYVLKPARPHTVSRSPLHLNEEAMRKLLTAERVMPCFLNYIHAFGMKSNDIDMLYGGCKHNIAFTRKIVDPTVRLIRAIPESFEVCYNFKFVVPNGRRGVDPTCQPKAWSLRQSAVYQSFDFQKQQNTWILVQPEKGVQQKLLETYKFKPQDRIDKEFINPLESHLIHLSDAGENWIHYYNALEHHFLKKTANAVSSSAGMKLKENLSWLELDHEKQQQAERERMIATYGPAGQDPTELLEVNFGMIQELQVFQELVQNFRSALGVNTEVITSLRNLNNELHRFSPNRDEHEVSWYSIDNALSHLLSETALHTQKVDSLLEAIRGRAELSHNLLQFQNAIALANSGLQKQTFANLKRQNSNLIAKVTEKSARDTISVKIMTIVALLYLPATFGITSLFISLFNYLSSSTFLQSGILTHTENDNPDIHGAVNFKRLSVSTESLLIYLGASIGLTILTLVGWKAIEKKKIRASKVLKQKVEEVNARLEKVSTGLDPMSPHSPV